jgi:hypothetical protein
MRPNCRAPLAGYRSAMPDKADSEDRTFNGLDGAHGQMGVEIEIDGTDPGVRVGRDVLLNLGWTAERFLKGRVEPPLLPASNQGGTAYLHSSGQTASERANLDPTPTGSGPHFEENGRASALFPLPRIEGHGFVPGARRDRRAFGEFLPRPFPGLLGLEFFAAGTPLPERGVKGAGRSKSRIDGSSPKQRRDSLRNLREWHHRSMVLARRMGEHFQGGEGFFRGKLEHFLVRLDDFKVEGHHTVEQCVIGRKVIGMLRVIVQALSDRRGRFRQVNLLAFPFSLSKYTAHRTYFQEMDQGLQPQWSSHALYEAWLAPG